MEKAVNKKTSKGSTKHSMVTGKNYFIRTVTHYYTGKLTKITDADIVLSKATWIADTGRFNDMLKTGMFNDVEPFVSDVIVNRSCIIDMTEIHFKLPDTQK